MRRSNAELPLAAGRPLPSRLRYRLEEGFQQDLGSIRVHADAGAARIARAVGARAFACGPHVFLDRDACRTERDGEARVLTHEIAHCLQQQAAFPLRAPTTAFGGVDDHHEREAWDAADDVLRGRAAPRLTPDASGLWRRAVSIQAGSAKLQITTRPTVQVPTVSATNAAFNCTSIGAAGEVTLQGAAGDALAGWQLGFIQAEWIETNWADYRGQRDADGSVFLQRARPPARPAQGCRDTVGPVSDIWYNTGVLGTAAAGAAFPAKITSTHYDKPAESYPLVINNSLTGKTNFLHEVQLEFHFCFVLTLRDPGLAFHHLKSLYWNVHWQARFKPGSYALPAGSGWTVTNVAGGHAAHVGHVIDGAPTDRRFVGVLTSPQGANCNAVAANASANPKKREARTWQNFAITG